MITGAGTPSSIDSSGSSAPRRNRPPPRDARELLALLENVGERSSSHERTTLPWRQVSARARGRRFESGRAAMERETLGDGLHHPVLNAVWIILA